MTRRDEAITAAGQLLAISYAERDQLAVTAGTQAVAEAAHYAGHPLTVGQIEAQYREMQADARKRATAA